MTKIKNSFTVFFNILIIVKRSLGDFFSLWKRGGGNLRFIPRESDPLFDSLEQVINGLGMSIISDYPVAPLDQSDQVEHLPLNCGPVI